MHSIEKLDVTSYKNEGSSCTFFRQEEAFLHMAVRLPGIFEIVPANCRRTNCGVEVSGPRGKASFIGLIAKTG